MHTFTDIDGRGDVTWYEQSGIMEFKGKLYFLSKCGEEEDVKHAARASLRVKVYTVDEYPSMLLSFTLAVVFITHETNPHMGRAATPRIFRHRQIRSSSIWRKAQALIKTWAAARIAARKERSLAFAMGWHSRLGRNSALSLLPDDILPNILAGVTQSRHAQRAPHLIAQ